jgi:enolase
LPVIEELKAREILDSRGRPTVLAECRLAHGIVGQASVPSGASTGAAEAVELRDNDRRRYRGLGCRKAVANVNGEISSALRRINFENQADLDSQLLALDGTKNKSRLGANAVLAVSLSFARAFAAERNIELWEYFAQVAGTSPRSLPRLTINLFSGGKHAGQQVGIQDVLLVPVSPTTVNESLAMSWEIYQTAADIALVKYGMRLLRADEGGMAPPFKTVEEMLDSTIEAIQAAGYKPGEDVCLAMDLASSHFFKSCRYQLGSEDLNAAQMIARIKRWTEHYPLVSVEDGLAEDDWENWPLLRKEIGDRALVVGDDLLCTNYDRIRRAIDTSACNALLLKVNQAGTLTEACASLQAARKAGWAVIVSVRSGETEDDWAANLAVGWSADQFKNGSVTQSERLAKYNRLLAIEEATNFPTNPWPLAQ